jgi:hypothetical protein
VSFRIHRIHLYDWTNQLVTESSFVDPVYLVQRALILFVSRNAVTVSLLGEPLVHRELAEIQTSAQLGSSIQDFE